MGPGVFLKTPGSPLRRGARAPPPPYGGGSLKTEEYLIKSLNLIEVELLILTNFTFLNKIPNNLLKFPAFMLSRSQSFDWGVLIIKIYGIFPPYHK